MLLLFSRFERTTRISTNEPHEGAARLTTDQVSAINRFPDDNPNPVMRIDADGHLIYANPASAPILRTIGVSLGVGVFTRPILLSRRAAC